MRPSSLGKLTVSILKGEQGRQRRELSKLIAALRKIKPDLVNLPNLMFVGVARRLKAELNVPILCTLGGEDIFLDQLSSPYREEAFDLIRERSRDLDGYIAVTNYYAAHASQHFDLPFNQIDVVPMGICIDDDAPAHRAGVTGDSATAGSNVSEVLTIGYLARICPEKGLARLCEAFVRLRRAGRSCRLRIAGYLGSADRDYLNQTLELLQNEGIARYDSALARAERAGLRPASDENSNAVEYWGELDGEEKGLFLRSLDLLCVPTVFPEAKGFYLLEALAHGVPVVQPRLGSFKELIDATGGGLLYDAHQPRALDEALVRMMDDRELRLRLGRLGREAVARKFTAEVMANRTWAVYQRYSPSEP